MVGRAAETEERGVGEGVEGPVGLGVAPLAAAAESETADPGPGVACSALRGFLVVSGGTGRLPLVATRHTRIPPTRRTAANTQTLPVDFMEVFFFHSDAGEKARGPRSLRHFEFVPSFSYKDVVRGPELTVHAEKTGKVGSERASESPPPPSGNLQIFSILRGRFR